MIAESDYTSIGPRELDDALPRCSGASFGLPTMIATQSSIGASQPSAHSIGTSLPSMRSVVTSLQPASTENDTIIDENAEIHEAGFGHELPACRSSSRSQSIIRRLPLSVEVRQTLQTMGGLGSGSMEYVSSGDSDGDLDTSQGKRSSLMPWGYCLCHCRTRFARERTRGREIIINERLVLQHRLGEMKKHSRCLFNPENNRCMMTWDLVSALLLSCLAVMTPMEAGFIKDAEAGSPRWIFNQLVNLFFLADLLLQFHLPYTVPTRYGEKLIFDRRAIACHYLRTWFVVDLISMIPFDLITPGKSLGALRAVRLLRLLKLLRLLRGIRIVRRVQTEVGLSFRKMMLGQLFMAVVLAAHWIACFLGVVSRWQGDVCLTGTQEECVVTWMTTGIQVAGSTDELSSGALILRSYLVAMHASMSILVHPHHYEPTNTGEQVAFIILMLAGGYIWTQVISRSTAIFTSLDRHRIFFQQNLDDVNSISYSLGLSPALRRRLRQFFLTAHRSNNMETWKLLVGRVSPQLRRDICREVNKAWVLRITVLSKCQSTSFVTSIAELLTSHMFAEGEIFGLPFHLYVVAGGLGRLVTHIHVLIKDAVWGEDHLLLTNRWLLSDNAAQAMTFLEVMTLKRTDFQGAVIDFPEFKHIIRQSTIKCILFRGMKLLAEAERQRRVYEEEHIAKGQVMEVRPSIAALARQASMYGPSSVKSFFNRKSAPKEKKKVRHKKNGLLQSQNNKEFLEDSFDQVMRLRKKQTEMDDNFSVASSLGGNTPRNGLATLEPQSQTAQLTNAIVSLTQQVQSQGRTLQKLSLQQETLMAQQATLTKCIDSLAQQCLGPTPRVPQAQLTPTEYCLDGDERPGFKYCRVQPGVTHVEDVEIGTWAERVGIRVGAAIVAVNGRSLQDLSDHDFREECKHRPLRLTLLPAEVAWPAASHGAAPSQPDSSNHDARHSPRECVSSI